MNSLTFGADGAMMYLSRANTMVEFSFAYNRIPTFGGKAPVLSARKRDHHLPSTSIWPGSRRFVASTGGAA